MVKIAEKRQTRNPLLPIFGIIVAVGLAVAAWFGSDILIQAVPQLKASFSGGPSATTGHLAIAVGLWLALLALAYFLVAFLAGKDPESAKDLKLPERKIKKKKY